jgi:hypothetical protein
MPMASKAAALAANACCATAALGACRSSIRASSQTRSPCRSSTLRGPVHSELAGFRAGGHPQPGPLGERAEQPSETRPGHCALRQRLRAVNPRRDRRQASGRAATCGAATDVGVDRRQAGHHQVPRRGPRLDGRFLPDQRGDPGRCHAGERSAGAGAAGLSHQPAGRDGGDSARAAIAQDRGSAFIDSEPPA